MGKKRLAIDVVGPADAKDLLERRLLRDPRELWGLRELLLVQHPDERPDLSERIRDVPEEMEALAIVYRETGEREDLPRALVLLAHLRSRATTRFTKNWWRWNLRTMEAFLDYGVLHDEGRAIRHVQLSYERFEALEVLEANPYREEMRQLCLRCFR